MKLTLDREDLDPKSAGKNCSQIRFEDLNEDAKAAVRTVGKGTFQEYDLSNYSVVYAPAITATAT